MPQLITADQDRTDEIMDGTYPIWGEGLSRDAYRSWNRAQLATAWGRDHLRRMAWTNDRTLLASAKRYDFHARVGGDPAPVLGIGAVFTPGDRRGRGHARELIEAMLADGSVRGCRYALLFSEIGSPFYESLGFRVLPRTWATLAVVPKSGRGAPATFVRSGETTDLPLIAEISARYGEGQTFSLERSPELIGFGFARRRLLAGFGPAGLREVEFFVAEEGHRPAAYVFITRGPAGAVLEECGDRDPSGARVGAILQVLAARTPADPLLRMNGWLPADLRPPQVRIVAEMPAPEIMMIRPIGDAPWPIAAGAPDLADPRIAYWQTDVF